MTRGTSATKSTETIIEITTTTTKMKTKGTKTNGTTTTNQVGSYLDSSKAVDWHNQQQI